MAGIVGNYLLSLNVEYRMSRRTMNMQRALNLAEAGLEEALLGLSEDSWSRWTMVSAGVYYTSDSSISFGDGSTGKITIIASTTGTTPIIAAEGRVSNVGGDDAVKQVFITLKTRSMFANGLTAKDSITFSGNNVLVDAYDSTLGVWDSFSNSADEGSVATVAVIADALSSGNGTVWGYGATGGATPDVGPNGWIGSKANYNPFDSNGYEDSRVTTDFTSDFPDVVIPSNSVDYTTMPEDGTIGVRAGFSPKVYKLASYSNRNNKMLTIDGPVIVIIDGDMDIKGEIEITEYGSAEFYVAGDASFGGNGVANMTNKPEAMQLYGTVGSGGSQSIKIHGNGQAAAIVYAPYADVTMNGAGSSGEMSGAVVGKTIKLTGNANFHYDLNLKNFNSDGAYQLGYWQELVGANKLDFSDYRGLESEILEILALL